ncbi:MOSC domain-containing protein [Candidatus Pelagibacter communis]|uniref:MOSC domain-containing protein n=1 Tax=Pelagibacter ubique TaxID=198252 RepID=UPI00065B3B66|nr:MOSC domain-containing protein [Candidatus Pelagibacter ubique]
MSAIITSIHNCPVKSISFQNIENCKINKSVGIEGDRVFAFSQNLNLDQSVEFEKNPETRKGKWNKIVTLKNTPVFNKYNFLHEDNKLTLTLNNTEIITVNVNETNERDDLVRKLIELEGSLKNDMRLMRNDEYPFYDTSISNKSMFRNSISLLNINSIKDFGNKIDQKIEKSIFRGNLYFDGIDAWEERNWIGKIIKINDVFFKVEKNIPRCVAINLKPETDDNSFNLLKTLKQTYDHYDMGVYLTPENDGEINLLEKIFIK